MDADFLTSTYLLRAARSNSCNMGITYANLFRLSAMLFSLAVFSSCASHRFMNGSSHDNQSTSLVTTSSLTARMISARVV